MEMRIQYINTVEQDQQQLMIDLQQQQQQQHLKIIMMISTTTTESDIDENDLTTPESSEDLSTTLPNELSSLSSIIDV